MGTVNCGAGVELQWPLTGCHEILNAGGILQYDTPINFMIEGLGSNRTVQHCIWN